MLEKVKMLIDNNGVGAVKKFTPPSPPPKSCLQGGLKCHSDGGGKKNFGLLHAPFVPLSQISTPPPSRSFPTSAPVLVLGLNNLFSVKVYRN